MQFERLVRLRLPRRPCRALRASLVALTFAVAGVGQTGCMTAVAAFQPKVGDVIVLTVTNEDGTPYERVVTPIDDDGTLHVSVNHWPRRWYRRVLERPELQVTRNGETRDYLAVRLEGEEKEAFLERHPRSFLLDVGMAFAPREILRFDPR